ncbi:polyhydroxyalkanoate synthesis repressor PhaR [uncultured Hyphomicrobium sp.]|uniref:polyhydroxyalkanoate synthesis repressor PhaR n=1 Tax=uncultured Hyphomicrobium sp. TaxID=194373 RepID=UPI0025F2AAE7|nr:polyhydroxyalkanoate synthesis repressor PhaR [uncultured Hyphomicrobium sp.]
MAQPMLNKSDIQPDKKEAVVIKKYANRRLYNTETSTYVTLDDLAQMVRNDKDFVVYDAKSGDDLTHAVLTQIIVEQESREGGQTLLPIPFLRQLIRFYDDNIGTMVPSYLQFSLENLVKEQEKFRSMFASAFANPAAAFEAYQDQARKNMAMFEQAMKMWTSFGGAANLQGKKIGAESDADVSVGVEAPKGEIDELKAQLSAMQQRIERLAKDRE